MAFDDIPNKNLRVNFDHIKSTNSVNTQKLQTKHASTVQHRISTLRNGQKLNSITSNDEKLYVFVYVCGLYLSVRNELQEISTNERKQQLDVIVCT